MWSDLGFDIPISEGRFWLDRGFIKAFTHDGEVHKLYKYKVFDDLTINITKYDENKTTMKSSFHPNYLFLLFLKFRVKTMHQL